MDADFDVTLSVPLPGYLRDTLVFFALQMPSAGDRWVAGQTYFLR